MFSLDNFYYILYKNLLEPINADECVYYPFGSCDPKDLLANVYSQCDHYRRPRIYFYDQEPLFSEPYNAAFALGLVKNENTLCALATSEHSDLKKSICKKDNWYDWYYFFHGFAALSWYNDLQYIPQRDTGFSKVFINLNHLMTQDRAYRMHLVAEFIERGILNQGLVSLPLQDKNGTWKTELFSPNSKLSKDAKKLIVKHIARRTDPLVVDTEFPQGWMSAKLDLSLHHKALWNVVTETVFYHKKLHLTEKTFKPIVSRRPFFLVAAPGNLAYLKSYGFKTFDQWIDESYDDERDPDLRIAKIATEVERLCKLPETDLNQMYQEMKPILEHNFQHFYTDFKKKIVHELVDNFEGCIKQYNTSRLPVSQIPAHNIDFNQVKRRLLGDW